MWRRRWESRRSILKPTNRERADEQSFLNPERVYKSHEIIVRPMEKFHVDRGGFEPKDPQKLSEVLL
jgi:hypothetical protein